MQNGSALGALLLSKFEQENERLQSQLHQYSIKRKVNQLFGVDRSESESDS